MLVPVDDGWQEIQAGKDYTVVAPDFIFRGGDGYDFSQARDVSKPGSELKYLVLDAVIRAQAAGRTVGAEIDAENRRIAFLADGRDYCFAP